MSKHLWPVDGAFVSGVPAIEQDVDDELAAELLAHTPPAFTLERPAGAKPPKPKRVRKSKQPQPAAEPAAPSETGE